MPPIRSESRQKLANQEGKILLAISNLKEGRIQSIRAVAKLYDIPRSTLQDRAGGRLSRVDKPPNGRKLT
jgi:alkylated DNA nucleotide flippase Atl1